MRFPAALVLVCLNTAVFAAEEHRVSAKQAAVHTSPSDEAPLVGYLTQGKHIWVVEEKNQFARLRSRSGKTLWIKSTELLPVLRTDKYDLDADVDAAFAPSSDFKRIRIDLGAAGGRSRGDSFIEGAAGLEYFMLERLSWRNAVFYRRFQVLGDFFGLDTSVRGNGNLPLGALKLRGIIGAGYRFAGGEEGAPFAEVGGFAALGGFDIGVMLKYLNRSISDSTRDDVVIYSVVLSGGGGFF